MATERELQNEVLRQQLLEQLLQKPAMPAQQASPQSIYEETSQAYKGKTGKEKNTLAAIATAIGSVAKYANSPDVKNIVAGLTSGKNPYFGSALAQQAERQQALQPAAMQAYNQAMGQRGQMIQGYLSDEDKIQLAQQEKEMQEKELSIKEKQLQQDAAHRAFEESIEAQKQAIENAKFLDEPRKLKMERQVDVVGQLVKSGQMMPQDGMLIVSDPEKLERVELETKESPFYNKGVLSLLFGKSKPMTTIKYKDVYSKSGQQIPIGLAAREKLTTR